MSDFAPAGQPQSVQNPALGSNAPQIQLPQAPAAQPQAPQAPQPQFNPYAAQPQQVANPYAAPSQPEYNPYGNPQPPQQSPFAAPPQGQHQFLPHGQVPPGQAAPPQFQQQPQWQQPQQQPNPAFQFNPYAQQQPAQQPAQAPAQQPSFAQQLAQGQQQQQPQQQAKQPLTAQQLAQQQGGLTDEQVREIFPDATSQAIFQGMNAISQGQQIDLLAAFGSAYERRDPTLVNERYLAQFDPATVNMLKGQFQALVSAGQQRDQAIEQSVYQQAGGKQNWDLAVQAFNASADQATIEAVAAAVNSGDPNQVRLAVAHILNSRQLNGNMIQRNGQMLTPNGGGSGNAEIMTRDNFYRHLDMLEKAHPKGSPQYQQFYQQLVQQRSQAKAQGY